MVPEPGGPGGPLAPPILGRSVNPIPTGEGRLSPPITSGTPNIFHLPASLQFSAAMKKTKVHTKVGNCNIINIFKGS